MTRYPATAEGAQWWRLVDPETGQADDDPELMERDEASVRNEWLEKQGSRWRWMDRVVLNS